MAEFYLIGKNGEKVGEGLQPVFIGMRDFYFKVPADTPRTPHVFEFLQCKDGCVLWAVPFDKVIKKNEKER